MSLVYTGGAALVLASGRFVSEHKLQPLARIVGYADAEQEPEQFTTTPAKAISLVLKKTGLKIEDIDLFEVGWRWGFIPIGC